MSDRRPAPRLSAIREFLKLESASGMLLVAAGVLAMIAANTPLAAWYATLLEVPSGSSWGPSGSTSRCCSGSTTC
jgi:Na+/H+ antiporter NhaA